MRWRGYLDEFKCVERMHKFFSCVSLVTKIRNGTFYTIKNTMPKKTLHTGTAFLAGTKHSCHDEHLFHMVVATMVAFYSEPKLTMVTVSFACTAFNVGIGVP